MGVKSAQCVFISYFLSFQQSGGCLLPGQINDSQAAPVPLLPIYELNGAPTAAQVLIMGPDDFIVAMVRYAGSNQNLAQRIIGTRKEVGVG